MKKNRQSTRLIGFDYSKPGFYFLTICTFQREHLFGSISSGSMDLNIAGKTATDCWLEIPEHFPHAILHEYVVMPNHIHGIIELMPLNRIKKIPSVGRKIFRPYRGNPTPSLLHPHQKP